MQNCNTCTYWKFVYNDGEDKFGICNSDEVQENVRFALDEDAEAIYTEGFFGCVFYDNGKDLVVAKIEI